jgi:hypothetical protein
VAAIWGRKTTINPIVGRSGRGDVRAEVREGGERVGGNRPIVQGGECNDKKEKNIKFIVALDAHQLTTKYTTTNQKQEATMKGSTEGMCNEREVCGKRDTVVLGVLYVNWR